MRVTCGYGYRPQWTVLLAIAVIVGAALGFFGIWELDREALGYPGSLNTPPEPVPLRPARAVGSLYLSVITFTTTGYGDLFPRSGCARLLAGLEAISGIVLVALFIFALTKRFGSLR